MKTLKFFVLLCIITVFSIESVKAQAHVDKDRQWTWYTDYGTYVSTGSQDVFTPSGIWKSIVTYQLDLNDPLVPDKGVNKLYYSDEIGTQVIYIWPDGRALVIWLGKDK